MKSRRLTRSASMSLNVTSLYATVLACSKAMMVALLALSLVSMRSRGLHSFLSWWVASSAMNFRVRARRRDEESRAGVRRKARQGKANEERERGEGAPGR